MTPASHPTTACAKTRATRSDGVLATPTSERGQVVDRAMPPVDG